jgi:threonine dehydrogenase-like Zn-dependent dehydrogenase
MQISVSPAAGDHPRSVHAPALAAVLRRPQGFELEEQPAPAIKPSELLVRLEGCGICASNLPVWQGRPWFHYPLAPGAPGHESWGEIVQVGRRLHRLLPDLACGQKVAVVHDRAFAGYAAVSVRDIVPLPPALAGTPFPGEAVGCAMNIFRRAEIREGQFVAVIGAGFLGLLLVQLAARAGARVVVLTRRQSARELALRLGAEAAFDTEDWWGNAQRVMEMTGGRGCPRVIEATGLQFALDLATEIVAEYGRLAIAGYHQDGPRQINMQKWNWRAIEVVNAHERDRRRIIQGMAEGVAAVESGRLRLGELLTHRFHLDRLNDGFRMMADRPDGFIKGWVAL